MTQPEDTVVPNLLGDEKLVRCGERGRGAVASFLPALLNQDTGSSSTVTVTKSNKSVGGEHGPLAYTAAVQGPTRAPPAMFQLPSLAFCCNSNAERVALEKSGSPQGRGVQLVAGAATRHFWARNTLCTEKQPWRTQRRQEEWSLLLLSGSSVMGCTTRIHLPGFEDPLLDSGKN